MFSDLKVIEERNNSIIRHQNCEDWLNCMVFSISTATCFKEFQCTFLRMHKDDTPIREAFYIQKTNKQIKILSY